MNTLKAIAFLVIVGFVIIFVMVSVSEALIDLSINPDFNVTFALTILVTFYLCTVVNRKNAKEAQHRGYAHIRLSLWEKLILFPMLKNLFTRENVIFQRILLLNTICILVLMMTIMTPIFQILTHLFHLIFNLTFARKYFETNKFN